MVQNISDPFIRTSVKTLLFSSRYRYLKDLNLSDNKKCYPDHSAGFNFLEKIMAVLVLVMTSPLILLISLLILLIDGRPVFFRQERLGLKGKTIKIFKFRTMFHDAEEKLKQDILLYEKYVVNDFKIPVQEDPRLLKFGKFLRRWSLDEIPQFINVLKGDMRIIGPRPIVHDEIERYGDDADIFLSVKPGITGLWQVSGRSDVGYPDRKYLDLLYILHRSMWLDVKIFFKTIWRVFNKNGAY